ncbi:toll/interleukin-1 receptor domain-containing protein, partial [Leucobacter komagatae]|uniref:toll/interleukin-1 receptor domain-containing protein n=1 Tax=Leucobacter komagatae TaxID=55969 RepID=UPI0012ECF417
MALLDRERILLLKTLSTNLADASLPDVNMFLAEAGLTTLREEQWTSDEWNHHEVTDADRREILIQRLRSLSVAELSQFAEVTGSVLSIAMDLDPSEAPAEPLRVFASHRDGQKAHVHEIAEFLRLLHITLFVAHDDINPGEEWVDRIEKELRTTHAGVIFLVPGFESSTFCDQEVGWMRGRSIPLHTLKYQTASPYGFFGRRQAQHVPDEWKASDVATNLVTWLSLQSEIAESFATSLALSLQSATSFDAANKRFGFIEHRRDLTAAQTAAV